MSRLFKALGHPTRARIFRALLQEEPCVCEITEWLDSTPSAVSQHLRRLRETGLVESSRRGQWIFYRSNLDRLKRELPELGLSVESGSIPEPAATHLEQELAGIQQQNLCDFRDGHGDLLPEGSSS